MFNVSVNMKISKTNLFMIMFLLYKVVTSILLNESLKMFISRVCTNMKGIMSGDGVDFVREPSFFQLVLISDLNVYKKGTNKREVGFMNTLYKINNYTSENDIPPYRN